MYLKVARSDAESVRVSLIKRGILDTKKRVMNVGDHVYIPVTKKVSIPSTEILPIDGEDREVKPASLRQALDGKLSARELKLVPTSFDIIGDITVLEIPDDLTEHKTLIGESLLGVFTNIKVVAQKTSLVDGEYRTRSVQVIAGEDRTLTVHREHGLNYSLDVSKAYFSPRLSGERMRVASQVKDGERVLVLFAGVGPYPILIARKANPSEVVAVELNSDAVEYMRRNVVANKAEVNVLEGDAREVTPTLGMFDRIVMPLPKDAGDFLDVVLPALNPGGVVHFYGFYRSMEEARDSVNEHGKKNGAELNVNAVVACGSFSPGVSRMCVDFEVKSR